MEKKLTAKPDILRRDGNCDKMVFKRLGKDPSQKDTQVQKKHSKWLTQHGTKHRGSLFHLKNGIICHTELYTADKHVKVSG